MRRMFRQLLRMVPVMAATRTRHPSVFHTDHVSVAVALPGDMTLRQRRACGIFWSTPVCQSHGLHGVDQHGVETAGHPLNTILIHLGQFLG